MDEIYNREYYQNYCGPIPYEDEDVWQPHFHRIAKNLIQTFHPKTVLDAGCAMGYLVAALRDKNVEAYGIDISEYAISKVREDIKPFCRSKSLTETLPPEFPTRYDLVVTIEVLEHLTEEEGKIVIENLCSYADTIIFSSSPDDFEEKTHINVQPSEYWAGEFYKHNFINMVRLQPEYLTDHAICFQKANDNVEVVEQYERGLNSLKVRLKNQQEETVRQLNNALDQVEKTKEEIKKVKERDAEIIRLHDQLNNKNKEYQECLEALGALRAELTECAAMRDHWEFEFNKIVNSKIWKAVKKLSSAMK
jgi:2-polyprenyl-3-methyl-5-hydroxy-6-metoxy-1,4-benzoquinol methylase